MNKVLSLGRLAKFWWIMAGILALLWLGIWLIVDPQIAVAKPTTYTEIKTQSDLVLPKKINTLQDLSGEVSPLSVESVKQDLRSYANEFKDKAFFEKNRGKWTVQVMDSTTHENIVNYLDIRKEKYQDRDKFYYFRYVDGSSKEHYVLIYDLFPNRVIANGVWQEREKRFALPRDMEIVVKPIREYLPLIDSYVREEMDEEVKIPKEPIVNLAEAKKEVKAQPAKPSEKQPVQPNQTVETQEQNNQVESPEAKKPKEPKESKEDKPKVKKETEPTAVFVIEEPTKALTTKPAKEKEVQKQPPKPEPVIIETVEPDPESVVTLESEVAVGGGQ